MSSGKKERILITCATFEVAKVVEPAKFYDATKVHIIHYGNSGVYKEFYDEVNHKLEEWKPNVPIISHDEEPVYDFTKMMNTIMKIIGEERLADDVPDIFVNISSGTHEFTAAAVLASMMWDNIIAFTTPTKEYTVDDKKVKSVYYDNDGTIPVGLTRSVKDPIMLSAYRIPKPEKKLVLGLGILDKKLRENKPMISAPHMIESLVGEGLMTVTYVKNGNESDPNKRRPDQKTIMNYQRNFVDKWIELKWVDRISKRELEITEEGRRILSTFLECYLMKKSPAVKG